jgi:uncharacterized RDD family membrane protein YckC
MSATQLDAETGTVPYVNDNPFPGLRPFHTGEEHLFFGRERQIDALVDRLAATRFLAVVGTSGSGKSSLVNCGLRPALHRGLMSGAGPSWRIVHMRPGAHPIRALAQALAADGSLYSGYNGEVPLAEVMETHLRMSSRGLVDVVKKARLPARTNLLLVVDQFEELFRYEKLRAASRGERSEQSEDATALVNLLLETSVHPEPIYVVLTMRSDFLGDCSHFHGLPEAINQGQYLVPRLSREERRAAIAGPIAIAGATIHPALLTRLVNDVGDNPDQLSILQHALNRTWARWKNQGADDRAIGLEDYEAIGTMTEALDRHAEKAYDELGDDRSKQICAKVFKALTDRGTDARGIRRPTTLARLCAITGETPAAVAAIIDVFRKPSRSFLMPPLPERLEDGTVVDVSHESLMRVWRRLKTWTEEEAQSARVYRRLADTAALHEEGKASLWGDPELQLALDWRRHEQPAPAWGELYDDRFEAAMAFLDRSRDVRNAARAEAEFHLAWRRIRTVLFSAAAVISLGWLVLFPQEGSQATPVDGGVIAKLLAFPDVAGALVRTLLGIVTPFAMAQLAGEYMVKPAYRRHRFGAIEHKIAKDPDVASAPVASGVVTPHVEPDLRWNTSYAPTWRRVVAFTIDGVIAVAILIVAFFVLVILEGTPADEPIGDAWGYAGVVFGLVLGWLYQTLGLTSARQATLGMRAARVIVTDKRGERLSFARATLRHVSKAASYFYGVGLLMQPFMKRKQALHDLLSGSVVLTRPRIKVDASVVDVAPVMGMESRRLEGRG